LNGIYWDEMGSNGRYPLVNVYSLLLNMAIEIVVTNPWGDTFFKKYQTHSYLAKKHFGKQGSILTSSPAV
jgi:hypothetical protein